MALPWPHPVPIFFSRIRKPNRMDTTEDTPPTTIVVTNNCTHVVPSNAMGYTPCPDQEHHALQIQDFMLSAPIQTILNRISDLDEGDNLPSALVPYSPVGYVYAAWNPLFQDLIKIGATMRQSPYTRVKELSTSGVPEPFQLLASITCKDPFALEKNIHAHYDSVRKFGRKKEFFMISRDEAVEFFHMKSIEAALMIEKPKHKPYPRQLQRQRRNHSQVLSADQAETYRHNIEEFTKDHLEVCKGAFTPSQQIKRAFISTNGNITSSDMFFKALRQAVAKHQFPINVVWPANNPCKGYCGLRLKM